jgi:hypothetical protein
MFLSLTGHRWVAGVVATCLMCGCAGWNQVRQVPPADYVSSRGPGRVRVALPETSLVLYSPSVKEDSLVGFLGQGQPTARVAVPASEIRKLEVRGFSDTTAAVFTGGCVALAVALAIISANHHPAMY